MRNRRRRLVNLDRRTFEAKLVETTRAELAAFVGGAPDIAQQSLIERAAWLKLQLTQADDKIATGTFVGRDHDSYLKSAKTLAQILAQLNIRREPAELAPRLEEVASAIALARTHHARNAARRQAARETAPARNAARRQAAAQAPAIQVLLP
jgi:hypothetical protein